ncbi:hypothetical protein TP70_07675 [Staphylococcus microti]|uniref:triacylglycerol lipase n=1 Tax=Staphylococcus microti TaxID=569857 RepID=A0A0D6XPV2_9STAP|nr:YSIRK-type signal peptide-containing protein [Staphylococcus microti]KIX90425.1 hypothetical protein TP70_07675 [Staphylococcus microti]PNZ84706.1 hypothetical protein CD132_00110 [Staphylococcus microti]SUM58443.1 triacylglycerol lipase [Staphylococcus microti]
MTNHRQVFSIRKSLYGATSVVVATCFFMLGTGDAEADMVQSEHAIQQTEVADSVEQAKAFNETASQVDNRATLEEAQKQIVVDQHASVNDDVLEANQQQAKPKERSLEVEKDSAIQNDNRHPIVTPEESVKVTDVKPTPVLAPTDKTTVVPVTHGKEAAPVVTDAPNAETGDKESVTAHTLRKADNPVETANPEQPLNQHPFVFVHGFMGMVGDVAPKGMNYWGGTKANLQDYIRNKGYEMYEASVSAIASNHERVVDLYHYIVGGRADYGAAHAEKYGHERYGKTYKGIYPDWQPGKPIHLIGHSMGGQTIRLLEHYLRNGNDEERLYQQQHGGTLSPLYQGGQDGMITSITTIATPHNGTHAADQLGNTPFIRHLLYGLTRTFGNHLGTLDLGMHHWGFKQREGESLIDYGKRVAQSQLWDSEDTALYDLTTTGAEKFNAQTSVNPNIYYKTFNGQATHKTLSGKHMIDFGMAFAHVLTGNLIGGVMDEIWRPNDGLVSVVSAQYPTGEAHVDVTADTPLQKGVWQVMPTMTGWDHSDFIGNDTLDATHNAEQLTDFYDELIDYLMRIEAEK